VRDRVEEAKTKVKQSFDVRYHVDQRPWQMLGLSVLTGVLLGRMAANRTAELHTREYASHYWRRQPSPRQETGFDAAATSAGNEAYPPSVTRRSRPKNSWGIFDQFQDEIAGLQGAAVGAAVSVIRDLLKSATDSFKKSPQSQEARSTGPRQTEIH
jgi:hypothetical protein